MSKSQINNQAYTLLDNVTVTATTITWNLETVFAAPVTFSGGFTFTSPVTINGGTANTLLQATSTDANADIILNDDTSTPGTNGIRVVGDTVSLRTAGVVGLTVDASQNVDCVADVDALRFAVTANSATPSPTGNAQGYVTASTTGGLTLNGQGSARDVTIRNNAGSLVGGVPTGTTNFEFTGDTDMSGNLTVDQLSAFGTSPSSGYRTYIYSNTTTISPLRVRQDNASATNPIVTLETDGSGAMISSIFTSASARTHMEIANTNGIVGSIVSSGTATSFNTTSDERLKSEFRKPTDSETIAKFNALYDSFGIWHWLSDKDKKDQWGYGAQTAIANGLDIATEGNGPLDAAIGSVYETEELPEITEEVTKEVQATETKIRKVASIEVIDGVPTQVTKTESYESPLFDSIQVVDEKGSLVFEMVESGKFEQVQAKDEKGELLFESVVIGKDEKGEDIVEPQAVMENGDPIMVKRPVMYKMPRMITVTETVVTQEAQTIEKKVTPYGVDQGKPTTVLTAMVDLLRRELEEAKAEIEKLKGA